MKTTASLTALLIGLIGACLLSAQPAPPKATYTVHLRNREFEPPPGVDPKLREALQEPAGPSVYGAIQMFRIPSRSDRDFLELGGITVREYLGGFAYVASFSRGTSIDAMTNALRWAGFLLPEDRVEKRLWEGKIKPSDMAGPDRIKLLVEFRAEVRTNEAQTVLAKHVSAYSPFGLTSEWAVEIPTNNVKALAAENSIWWIRFGPSDFRPLAVPAK